MRFPFIVQVGGGGGAGLSTQSPRIGMKRIKNVNYCWAVLFFSFLFFSPLIDTTESISS